MARTFCDICKKRLATKKVKVIQNNREQFLNVCNLDYSELRKRARNVNASPFDSFFQNSPMDGFFNEETEEDNDEQQIQEQRESVNILDYLSDHSKKMIQQAAQIAIEKFGRKEVDTEHLLYSIIDNNVVQEVLKQFKINDTDIKGFIEYNAPKQQYKDIKEVGFTPRVKHVLELAFGAAQQMGHGYIGPEHLLVALAKEEDGIAGELLRKYGLTAEAISQKAVKIVGKGAKEGQVESQSNTPKLDKFSRDLTKFAREGKLDPVIGRSEEIETTIEILSRRTKNNPVLIGEPGVGKTAIVEGLAQKVINGDVPETLQNKRVVELSLNALVAGSKFRGELEERMKEILDEIAEHRDELIIFIDEIHTIMSAGAAGDEGGLSLANVMKPTLARGELHLIGATTLNEYQKHIEKDAALERRFQPVFVPEPTIDQTIEILRGLRDKYEVHHKVKITDHAMTAAAELSSRYIHNRFLPDKAVDLIDQAASRVRIQSLSHSKEMQKLDENLTKLTREREYAAAHKETDKEKELAEKIEKLTKDQDELMSKWRMEKGVSTPEVTVENIAEVVSKITGVPVKELTQEEKEKLLKMEEKLHERIISQDEAIEAVSNAIRISRAGLNDQNRPQATFLFLGPTGVGKTELVKALAWTLFGDEDAVIRIDMSEYMERHAVARLIGAPPGYVGYEEGGQLTERVRRRPYSVILLDEIEKAHPDVYNVLLQLFDEGRLTDGKGRNVNFTNTIIIATSNIGADVIQQNTLAAKSKQKIYPELKNDLMNLLRGHFRPEFLNRIDDIIVFQPLGKKEIKEIVKIQLERIKNTARGQNIELVFGDYVIDYLAEVGYAPEFGARELKRKIKTEVENPLARELLSGNIGEGDKVEVQYSESTGVVFVKQ